VDDQPLTFAQPGKKKAMRLEEIALKLQDHMTPIIAASAAIIAFISARNVHLSDRSRANVDEGVYKLHQATLELDPQDIQDRLTSLRKQNTRFFWRYCGTSIAFVLSSLSFILFSAASICVYLPGWMKFGVKVGVLAAGMTTVGFGLLITEFLFGWATLKKNNEILKRFKKVIRHTKSLDLQ
jgi:hypothetical protein